MENALATSRKSNALCAIMAIALVLSGVLGVQALTADEAYAAQKKPKVTLATPVNVQLEKGDTHKIQAKASEGAKLTYKSSKKSVATVSKLGVVTAKKPGSATITIKAKKGKRNASKKVCVKVVKATQGQALAKAQAPSKAREPEGQPVDDNSLIAVGPGGTVGRSGSDPNDDAAAKEAAKNATHSFLFIPNGAQDKAFTQDVKGNGAFALPTCTFTRAGYEFAGWNTKEDGSGTSYAAAASFQLPNVPSLHVFYAQWKAAKRTGEYTESGKVYYYDANGNKVTGWQTVNGAKRYYDPADDGARVGAGERQISKQLLFGASSDWYLFDANGTMLTGWQNVNGKTKFFRADGTRAQGEVYIAKGELGSAVSGYRYFDANGVIQLGWHTIGGADKYFELNDGVRASGVFAVPHEGGSNAYYFNTGTGARMANVVQGGYYFRPGDGVGMKLANIQNDDYEIVSALGSEYLDVSAASTADCANVQIWECTHTNAQIFTVQKASGNYYKIVNANSGKAVDVTGGDSRNGVNVHQYTWNGTDAQLWLPVECNGGVAFFNKATSKVLDVASAICANGTNVQSWEFNDSQAQVWKLYQHPPYDRSEMTEQERETAYSIWKSYCEFRSSKGVPAVTWSDYCARLAFNTAKACSQIGRMQHKIAIPEGQRMTYSDILQYATWRKAGPEAIQKWYDSEGHHRMMRNDHGTTEAGVGVYFDGAKWWYVIVYNFNGRNQYEGTLW